EACPPELARRWSAGRRFVNAYGPTEMTVVVTLGADAGERPRVPLGRPVPETAIHVLGPGLEPVPVGVAGELCAAGPGMARGYLGRPELTAERFVPDPFGRALGAHPVDLDGAAFGGRLVDLGGAAFGGRLYRTGDLARW